MVKSTKKSPVLNLKGEEWVAFDGVKKKNISCANENHAVFVAKELVAQHSDDAIGNDGWYPKGTKDCAVLCDSEKRYVCAETNIIKRPANLDEDGLDEHGYCWFDGVTHKYDLELRRVKQ